MSIIVETGTGASDSEVLCSVAFADTYHANLGNTLWGPLLTVEKEAALRRAYAYMQETYRFRWSGYRVNYTQALDWPRQQVRRADNIMGGLLSYSDIASYYPFDAIPLEVQKANAELAFRAASGDLLADVDSTTSSESIGPIKVTYFDGANKVKKYPVIDRLLTPFMTGKGNLKVVRT